jgi:UDP-glucose 4-epimerase
MKLLVTGGSGFVGSHVVEALKSKGYDVLIFDIQLPQNKDGFFQGDLTKLEDLLQATQGIDVVCHLAAVGDVYLAFEKPYLAAELNVTGTANLMEACLRNGVQKVIYASTWEVYGEPIYQPIDEQHPCNPDHPYNITKLAGERMALAYDRLKGVPTISLRLGTSYGERMRPNSVFSIFIRRAMNEEPLTIKGGGMQSRQFTHARDVGLAFARAIEAPVRGEVFNVVAPESTSIKRLAELVLERLPTEATYEEARVGDVPPARVSAQKAKEVLGWEASVPFEQ